MKRYIRWCMMIGMAGVFASCHEAVSNPQKVDSLPEIYPDYIGVTIPATVAPMNFDLPQDKEAERVDVLVKGKEGSELHINAREVSFPLKRWHELLAANVGDSLSFLVSVRQNGAWKQYRPFSMYVSPYPIDYGMVYRKVAPGYEVYSQMGIYERNLSTFEERALLVNTLVPGMCVNCHSFNKTNPSRLSLHIRGEHGATLMQRDGKQELLATKTPATISNCVYPYWHPSGEYIAYSTNKTGQSFHANKEKLIEVFDSESDVQVYHPETHRLFSSPLLQRKEAFETFPVFSADGGTLYFCSSPAQEMPKDYRQVRYSICSIPFSAEGGFGNRVDTLLHADEGMNSLVFPRPSYDGKYLMYTACDYGTFPIWHKESDLWLLDLHTGEKRRMDEVNSDDVESFHNWSSNSRWFLFSSRRGDGRYTRVYLASIDEEGRISKPFLLPQERPSEYYLESLYSYNVPDFVSEPVQLNQQDLEPMIVSDNRIQVENR